jgi:hypothetical protein
MLPDHFCAAKIFFLDTFFDSHKFFRQPRGGFGTFVTTGNRFATVWRLDMRHIPLPPFLSDLGDPELDQLLHPASAFDHPCAEVFQRGIRELLLQRIELDRDRVCSSVANPVSDTKSPSTSEWQKVRSMRAAATCVLRRESPLTTTSKTALRRRASIACNFIGIPDFETRHPAICFKLDGF